MTRLNPVVNPSPGKVLNAFLAQGIVLWEKALTEDARREWSGRRIWGHTPLSPASVIAIAGANAALTLYEDPATHEHAYEYLMRLLRFGRGFTSNVNEMLEQQVMDCSPCIQLHNSMSGGWWYYVLPTDSIRMELVGVKDDPVLVRFVEAFVTIYPDVVTYLQEDGDTRLEELVSKACDDLQALFDREDA